MSVESSTIREKVVRRAEGLDRARSFFRERGIVEVDCLALSSSAAVDVAIDLFAADSPVHSKRFLFSSPEYPMKRLLCDGVPDIFYLGHAWRHGESGHRHSPEFLIAEWYRQGISFEQMMQETVEFAELFIGKRPCHYLSYQEAFVRCLGFNPHTASHHDLVRACAKFKGHPVETSPRDDLLDLLLAMEVEPSFDGKAITVLYHYPASQAALARHSQSHGLPVAERFELYAEGLELANGYHELANPHEQKCRFLKDNEQRMQANKEPYPVDYRFLEALEKGLPDCCGVAVGVDRLLMLQHDAGSIHDVIPIPWELA